mmetsp:Transcript_47462/g.95622  ORF Transcript_47462/g.95622 Transcript_47462/m.95622 type:complete len:164 (+) Transcript_47462:99-590(+)
MSPTEAPTLLPSAFVETPTPSPSLEPIPSTNPTPAPSFVFHYMHHHGHRAEEPDLFIIFASTLAGMFGMLAILLVYRHCLKKREYTYTRVHHGLDPEEEEFKKTLESQSDEIDELFNFSTDLDDESGADLEFDASELEQIEMLETYRSNLVAAADSPSGGQEK